MKQHELIMAISYVIAFICVAAFAICIMGVVLLMIRHAIRNFKNWNEWRKHNMNSEVYKLLVLLGLAISPTFMYWNEWKKSEDRFYDKRIDSDTTISILVGDDIKEATDDE